MEEDTVDRLIPSLDARTEGILKMIDAKVRRLKTNGLTLGDQEILKPIAASTGRMKRPSNGNSQQMDMCSSAVEW